MTFPKSTVPGRFAQDPYRILSLAEWHKSRSPSFPWPKR